MQTQVSELGIRHQIHRRHGRKMLRLGSIDTHQGHATFLEESLGSVQLIGSEPESVAQLNRDQLLPKQLQQAVELFELGPARPKRRAQLEKKGAEFMCLDQGLNCL